jgi:hypothetical protein
LLHFGHQFIPSRMIAPRWGGVARRRYREMARFRQPKSIGQEFGSTSVPNAK